MATEEAQVVATTEEVQKGGGGLVKTIGLAVVLFFVVIAAHFVTAIVGCMVLPGLMPGCAQHVEEAELTIAEDKAKKSVNGQEGAGLKVPPQYLAFDPPLVVSVEDQESMRFLQVTVEVMAREEEAITAVETHMPVIRNNLLMLLAGKTVADLTSRAGKEALRQESLKEVQKILKDNAGTPGIEDLYFTTFVVR